MITFYKNKKRNQEARSGVLIHRWRETPEQSGKWTGVLEFIDITGNRIIEKTWPQDAWEVAIGTLKSWGWAVKK